MTVAVVSQLVVYPVSERDIAESRAEFEELQADTKEGYERVRHAIAHLRTTRGAIEKRRVELKADALDYGRRVDAVAKKLTAMVTDIEEFLKARKQAVDVERERQKREVEKAELIALEAKIRADREAEEAVLKAAREVEEAALREEGARLAAIAEQQKAERDAIDAQTYALAELRQTLEAQAREATRAETQRQQLARIAEAQAEPGPEPEPEPALQAPFVVRSPADEVRVFAGEIRALAGRAPALEESPKADEAIGWAQDRLEFIAVALEERFKPKDEAA